MNKDLRFGLDLRMDGAMIGLYGASSGEKIFLDDIAESKVPGRYCDDFDHSLPAWVRQLLQRCALDLETTPKRYPGDCIRHVSDINLRGGC